MADGFDQNQYDKRDERDQLMSWIPTLIMLFCFFPVGIIMLIVKLFGLSGKPARRNYVSQHPYDIEHGTAEQTEEARRARAEAQERVRQARQQAAYTAQSRPTQQQAPGYAKKAQYTPTGDTVGKAKKKAQNGRDKVLRKRAEDGHGLVVGGGILAAICAVVSMIILAENVSYGFYFWDLLEEIIVPLGFCGGGLVMCYYGLQKKRKSKRWRKYLALIGKRSSISVVTLAEAMGVSVHKACDDLQDMLDAGVFPVGFLDVGGGRLILSDEGLYEQTTAEEEKEPEEEAPKGLEQEDAVLAQIRQVNDDIEDPEMSRKIDRIGAITRKIFAYVRQKPEREGQLRSFLSYYLPTTLKILRAYAQMESQGIEGENISAAKKRIEGMMDKIVDGFEMQLDRLFQDDAMDITTDVAVLEQMLHNDGLGGGEGLTLGG